MSTEPVTRSTVDYKEQFDRFIVNTKNFSQQYNKIYLARLSHMRDALRTVAAKKWPECSILPKIIDIESEHEKVDGENKEFILIGTLYKDMSLRGSVLDEFKEKNGISGAVQSFYQIASKNDSLVLEDESGRVALGGPLLLPHVGELVTGVVMAVKGCVDDLGVLNVQDWTFMHSVSSTDTTSTTTSTSGSGSGTVQEQQYNIPTPTDNSKYILLVSGLQLGNPTTSPTTVENTANNVPAAGGSELSAQLLFDFVAGRLTGRTEDIAVASKIARVIIAGDSVAPIEETALVKDKQSSFKAQKLAVSPSKQFDVLLGQLLAVCPVDLLPGETDPSNLTLPQQPLHPCLFPHSSRFNSFHRVTNPYQARMDHITVLGHSGQAVSDIARQRLDCLPDTTTSTEAMEVEGDELVVPDTTTTSTSSRQQPPRCSGSQSVHILRDTLSWGHLCPTSPDTLACYPFETVDPFIVPDTDIPDVLFCGNQNEYGTALVSVHNSDGSSKQVRLVSLPCFSTTGQAVLVDINSTTLTTTVLHFR